MGLSEALDLILFALAVWRVSYMLIEEEGPFFIFDRMRVAIGLRLDADDKWIVPFDLPGWRDSLASLFACIYCLSVWVALLFFLVYLIDVSIARAVAVPFALSALALGYHDWSGHGPGE